MLYSIVSRFVKEVRITMQIYLDTFFLFLRPAFSRKATFAWFVVIFAGFIARYDAYGVTSIVRALGLPPACYLNLLHCFHSTAWSSDELLLYWWRWLMREAVAVRIGGRRVFLGDHTKTPKDGRRMPGVTTLHEDSETSSKPSYFRGHHWACLSLLAPAGNRNVSLPLWAEIHRESDAPEASRATRLVAQAGTIAQEFGEPVCLVLDAFFATGPVFHTAARQEGRVHVLTRAKCNVVAYRPVVPPKKRRRGRPRFYGQKLKLFRLFDLPSWSGKFHTTEAEVYGKKETLRYLVLDLLWKPIKGLLRFILIESSHGRIIVMTSDLNLTAQDALRLYGHRASIETLFHQLKNLLGGMAYHFWSKYLQSVSRQPVKNGDPPRSSRPKKTRATLEAIERFVRIQLVALGMLHLLSSKFPREIGAPASCWLRTPCGPFPSPFVTRTVLAQTIRTNMANLGKDLISSFIREKAKTPKNSYTSQDMA